MLISDVWQGPPLVFESCTIRRWLLNPEPMVKL